MHKLQIGLEFNLKMEFLAHSLIFLIFLISDSIKRIKYVLPKMFFFFTSSNDKLT